LDDRLSNLNRCTKMIGAELGEIIKLSSIYETAPWGKSDQPDYLNQAVQIETNYEPLELLSGCLTIEKKMGRARDEKWGARLIDIDIIYFNDQILNSPDLIIPHARMAERKFVLMPLTEISQSYIHPVLKKTNEELLRDCKDQLPIKYFTS
jgi:2-amino-4-hydroxy-6-hydroxymethyldihydropteridine diphosphokinase